MLEIHIPKTWSYGSGIGVWECSYPEEIDKDKNELYRGYFKGITPLRFPVDKAILRIRHRTVIPVEIYCTGIVTVPEPIRDTVIDDVDDERLIVAEGKIFWT